MDWTRWPRTRTVSEPVSDTSQFIRQREQVALQRETNGSAARVRELANKASSAQLR